VSAPRCDRFRSDQPVRLFCSYSHEDEELRDELEKHLSGLERRGLIAPWHDRRIEAASEWAGEIDRYLSAAQIILLLVSADFLASDYCYDLEMRRAIERHHVGSACVIPVILREVDWHDTPFAKLQVLPKNGKPVTSWSNRDEAFADVARGIRQKAEELSRAGLNTKSQAPDVDSIEGGESLSESETSPALSAGTVDSDADCVPPSDSTTSGGLSMAKSKQKPANAPRGSLVPKREGPNVAPEMARLLGETATAADKTAQDYALLRAQLRELQIEEARLNWQLDKDGGRFVEEFHRIYREESEVFAKWADEVYRVQRQIELVRAVIANLNGKLEASDPSVIKVVVELDMARYGEAAKGLEDKHGPGAVMDLNRQIRSLITDSIKSVGAVPKRTFWKSTGDGAILVFDDAALASKFAGTLQETAGAYNRGKRSPLEQRHFRVGVATGAVVLEMQPEEGGDAEAAEMAGMVIANAARIEAACRTGEVLIDHATRSLLAPELQDLYGDQEMVRGKRKELIPAHRRAVVKRAPWDKD
jgi:class 3 adenylate cyclase